MQSLNKYATDNRLYVCDFSLYPEIVAGDTLASVSSATFTGPDNVLTVGTRTISGNTAKIQLSSGTAGAAYTVTVVVTTTQGSTLTARFRLFVES